MTEILWLTPDKPDNISVGRRRIADGLRQRGHSVKQRAWSAADPARLPLSGVDCVVATTTAAAGLASTTALGRPALVVDHVDPIRQAFERGGTAAGIVSNALERVAFRAADGVLFVYDEERRRVGRRASATRKTTLGVDVGAFTPPARLTERPIAVTDGGHLPDDYAVYIGALEPLYHIESMLIAAEIGGFELVIAGTGSLTDRVEAAASGRPNVTYLGAIPPADVPPLLWHASAGLCLVDDAHTTKALEYACAGLPIVQARGTAEREMPTDGVAFVRPDQPDCVAQAAKRFVKDGADIDALETWAAGHDYERVINDYETMIQEAV